MKKFVLFVLSLSFLSFIVLSEEKADSLLLKDFKSKLAYSLGMDIGNYLKSFDPNMDLELFLKGVKDEMAGKALLTKEQVMEVKMQMQKELTEKKKKQAEENLKISEKFLEENKTKKGIKTTESGLQYMVITEGTGPKPTATDKVKVHYAGTLIDGKEFDSSYKRNEPVTFPLNGVIKGWTEGLQLMKTGSKYRFFIPPALGYGERGAGDTIPPNSVLIFDVELLSIEK